MGQWQRYRAASADLILGVACVSCGAPGVVACAACLDELDVLATRSDPSPRLDGLPPVYSTTAYGGAVRAMLIAHKEEAKLSLAKPLGRALARSVIAAVVELPDVWSAIRVVAVPSPPARVRERGHDPLRSIARVAVRELRAAGVEASIHRCLRIAHPLADQAGLTALQRRDNLDDAFVVPARFELTDPTQATVVVDDIVTTGASARAAASALTDAGAEVVGIAVIAATARRVTAS